jgi:hypothetical protein
MCHKLSIEKILPLLEDPEKDVKDAALRSLQAMTDQKLTARAEWEDWWAKNRATIEEEARKVAEARKAQDARNVEDSKKMEAGRAEEDRNREEDLAKPQEGGEGTPDPKKP